MIVTVDRTLFLLSLDTLEVTICTWEGEEASMPILHLCAFVDHVRATDLQLPPLPPVILREAEEETAG